jgi:hypothetical protein
MLQNMAKLKMHHDLQKMEEANNTQKENQAKIDTGLKMFALCTRWIATKLNLVQIFI